MEQIKHFTRDLFILMHLDEGALTVNETRQEILKVATRHFAAMDYAAVNLETIAREAHVTRAPLYYYFGSKEGLYRAVVAESLSDARGQLEAILGSDDDVFEIIRREYAYCVHGMSQYRGIWDREAGAPDCRKEIAALKQWILDRKLALFAAAREKGQLAPDCDITELATLIYVFFFGTMDTLREARSQTGFNRALLDGSEEWFMSIVRQRFGR